LEACAETLETLRLYPADLSRGKSPCLGLSADSTHSLPFPGLNLSRLKTLRSLQFMAWICRYDPPRDLLILIVIEAFSTITSPLFSELVIVRSNEGVSYLPQEVAMFQTLREMHRIRPFKLVFLFEGPYYALRGGKLELVDPRQDLEKAVDDAVSKGFLNFLDSPPTIRINARSRYYDWTLSDFD